jgi:hypothetical protein
MGEARLIGIAAIREQPVDLVADDVATLLDAPMVAVGRIVLGLQHVGWRIVEKRHHIAVENRPVGLERQQVVATSPDDLFRDIGLGPHGVDGDQRSRFEPLEQERNSHDLSRWTCRRRPADRGRGADGPPRRRPDAAAPDLYCAHGFAVRSCRRWR